MVTYKLQHTKPELPCFCLSYMEESFNNKLQLNFISSSVSPCLTFIKLPQQALCHGVNFKCTKAEPCLLCDTLYKTGIEDSYKVQCITALFPLQVTHREQLWSYVRRLDCLTSRGPSTSSESMRYQNTDV